MKNSIRLFNDSYVNWKMLSFTGRGRKFWAGLDEYMTAHGNGSNMSWYGLNSNLFLARHCPDVLRSADFSLIALAEKLMFFFREYGEKNKKCYVLPKSVDGSVDGIDVINDMSAFFSEEKEKERENNEMYYWEKAYNLYYSGDDIRIESHGLKDEQHCVIGRKEPHVINKAFSHTEVPEHSWYIFNTDFPFKLYFTTAAVLSKEQDIDYNRELLSDLTALSQLIMRGKYIWNGSVIEIKDIVNRIMPSILNADHNRIALKRLKRVVASDHSVYCAYADSVMSGSDPHWMLETALMNVRLASGKEMEPEKVHEMTHLQLINSIYAEVSDYFRQSKKETRGILDEISDLVIGSEDLLFSEENKPDVQLDELPMDLAYRWISAEVPSGYSYHPVTSEVSGFKIGKDNPLRSWMGSFYDMFSEYEYKKFKDNESYKEFVKGAVLAKEEDAESEEMFSYEKVVHRKEIIGCLPEDFDFRPFIMVRDILSLDDMAKVRYFDILSIKKTLSSCARTLHLTGRLIRGLKDNAFGISAEEGDRFLSLSEEILDYCYKNSRMIWRKLEMYADAPLDKNGYD